ncbi:hypothetical protein [Amycolatopsis alkalitolerans]|uniref:Uncharacterized protein n=1 Tax=Amycolatopsis alkalitolerans TaxID=2547244 RepID=A0A5C4LYT9_9PSEU|nr:hypothetical protein [Amycolatopsis alkalitolerans]TNC23153.1 hypothetical protein FG385_22415 [Amycolatopsis alkalitolerans]
MKLELTAEEAKVLHEVLAGRLGDYSAEIAATDNPSFRRQLRERRDVVHRVQLQLEPYVTAP